MSKCSLAISNIPMQEWGPLYSEQEALNIGTIFQDLNKPFFAAEIVMDTSPIAEKALDQNKLPEQLEREQLMTRICEVSFFLEDLSLYLDTHEQDTQAIQLYNEKAKELAQIKKEFAQKFYPLSKGSIPDSNNSETFSWQKGPMPWEGACV